MSRRYSASSTKGALSQSGCVSITSRKELPRTRVSSRLTRSKRSTFTQLHIVLGGKERFDEYLQFLAFRDQRIATQQGR